jgi:hypothetical protein
MNENEYLRTVPRDAIDAQQLNTNPVWGTQEINPILRNKLNKRYLQIDEAGNIVKDEDGNPVVIDNPRWEMLAFFTRDFRLGNLTGGESEVVEHYSNLAADCLMSNYNESFVVGLSRATSLLEISQSRKGFFRKWNNTLRTVTNTNSEPPKRSLFGSKSGGTE